MDFDAAVASVAAADPQMGAFIARAGAFEPRAGSGDYFASLARSIMYQQLAGRAAAAIHGRFLQAIGGGGTPHAEAPPTPHPPRAARASGHKTHDPARSLPRT